MAWTKWSRMWLVVMSVAIVPGIADAEDMPPRTQAVLSTLGKKGDFKDGVLKVNIPRSDLQVTIGSGRRRRRSGSAGGSR